MLMLRLALATLVAYLIGSIPVGVLLARAFGWPDPRANGSGHTGALNTFRGAGWKGAALVLILDIAKGLAAALVARPIAGSEWALPLAGMAVTAGHAWPLWLAFRGGMGLATGAGAVAAANPLIVVLALAMLGVARAFINHTPRAVVASMLALPPVLLALQVAPTLFWLATGTALVIALRHLSDWDRVYGDPQAAQPIDDV